MIASASVYTFEIDEPEVALAEIRQQLEAAAPLGKHSVGLLQCDPEFIESGVVSHLATHLEFPIIGSTSAGQATNGAVGDLILTMLVLTSDDTEFVVGRTKGLPEDLDGAVARSYQAAAGEREDEPKLIVVFPPLYDAYAGDAYIQAFERLCGPVPVFGSQAVDDAIVIYDRCRTVLGQEATGQEMAYLLVYGPEKPVFYLATVPPASGLTETGVITKARDNVIEEISGVRAIDFFQRMGLAENGALRSGVEMVPFLMTLKNEDGSDQRPFVRALIGFDENGFMVCRGTMYEGAAFTIGSNAGSDVISTTLDVIGQVNQAETNPGAALIFSCVVRRMTLGADPHLEFTKAREALRPDLPYMMAYSGGEICPTAVGEQGAVNRFHNYTFIVCLL